MSNPIPPPVGGEEKRDGGYENIPPSSGYESDHEHQWIETYPGLSKRIHCSVPNCQTSIEEPNFCPNGCSPRMTRDDTGNWNCPTCHCVMVLQTVWSNPEPWRTRRV